MRAGLRYRGIDADEAFAVRVADMAAEAVVRTMSGCEDEEKARGGRSVPDRERGASRATSARDGLSILSAGKVRTDYSYISIREIAKSLVQQVLSRKKSYVVAET